jgi:glycosyltransferase involved in cell wall biosynthesis
MKMRILFLGDSLSNSQQWIRALEQYGNIEIIHWSLSSKRLKLIEWFFYAIFGKILFKKYKADIVLGYRTTSYGFLAARSGIKPCVIAAQGATDIWPNYGLSSKFREALRKYACHKSDMIHVWGFHMATSILEYGISHSKIFVCPRGIDLQLYQSVDNNFDIKKVIKFVSTRSLFPDYGYDTILKALKIIHNKGYDFEYYIAGDGSSKEQLIQLVNTYQLENKVKFLGFVPHFELPELLKQSHIYLSMPITEGVSASLFEAMASKCYPIVSSLPANKLFIKDGINGNLVKVDDYKMLVQKIESILNNELLFRDAIEYNFKYVYEIANIKTNINLFKNEYTRLINLQKSEFSI